MGAPALAWTRGYEAEQPKPVVEQARDVAEARTCYFKVTRRLDTRLLSRFQRWAYELLCRRIAVRFRVPPVTPLERGGSFSFDKADEACKTPDDQIHVLPFDWFYEGDRIDPELVCRPRDTKDRANAEVYARLKTQYAGTAPHPAQLGVVFDALWPQFVERLQRLHARTEADVRGSGHE